MNFENVYWDWNRMQSDHHMPSILAIGDSWFWYPFPGGSLLNPLGRVVASKEHYILAIGNNGAEAFDYVYGKYAKSVRAALSLHGSALSSVWISGGGNDFAGINDLLPLLNGDCRKATNAGDCFRSGDGERTLNWLLRKTAESYRALIGQILASTDSRSKVVMHDYDYAFPTGKGVFGNRGSWLKPALDNAGVPAGLQHECIRHLIDRLTVTLQDLTRIDPQRIFLVDSRNTLAEADWANELHPKPAGFQKIALRKWQPLLKNLELA
ncbi:SGNH/GDSL hydrolase family protein [Accumulibacter sp.]|uniref:SGNH/GDSL hydrolase family protein n=1 Tax=Accumulibacter sp. TaxID=2053492 RepID=UPI0025EA4B38|nr:SGNH/GDSL hydrolase family protein [Accumulibacter sp.]MCM8595959.1 SGNH/GDSL hydrolase family protein [Accumulibacter sp.]MCM8625215.1 SGNH/GDSL hydrolase family protein [Accumulibacter sp.]MDS4050108.1 SGNH/GDSL hydrolase family protein [Accumulibacter sp.]